MKTKSPLHWIPNLPLSLAITLALAAAPSVSSAATILADDFTGVTKSGSTATITSWDTEDSLTATTSFPAINDQGVDANYFDVNAGELDVNASVWGPTDGWDISFDVTLDSGTSIDLTTLDLVSWSINNSGGHRTNSGAHAWTLTIVGDGTYGSQSASGLADYGGGQSASATIDLLGLDNLVAGENYTFTLGVRKASGDSTYATLDSFSLSGNVSAVPEPSAFALVGLAGMALLLRRRR